jgi:2,3-bisphosphoglycerate-dependent phosphoglycerate mutase
MKKGIIVLFALLVCYHTKAQPGVTTVMLIRHAEKVNDDSRDPDLSVEGRARAQSLVKILKKTKVDAIYSTGYKRTRNTVIPLALAKGLPVLGYSGSRMEEVDSMLQKFRGGTILICGHSNTTPAIINYLTGHKDEYQRFDDNDYGNLVMVLLVERGKNVKVSWHRY